MESSLRFDTVAAHTPLSAHIERFRELSEKHSVTIVVRKFYLILATVLMCSNRSGDHIKFIKLETQAVFSSLKEKSDLKTS